MSTPDPSLGARPADTKNDGPKVEPPAGDKVHKPVSMITPVPPPDTSEPEKVAPETTPPDESPKPTEPATAAAARKGAPPPPPVPGWMHQTAHWISFHARSTTRRIWGRRGAPAVLFGAALIVLGATLDGLTTLRVPVITVGVILLVLGMLGPRLRMRLGLRLEDEGLDISMQLGVAARPDPEEPTAQEALPAPAPPAPADRIEAGASAEIPDAAEIREPEEVPEVLDSTAETISFDAELIRAAALKADRKPGS